MLTRRRLLIGGALAALGSVLSSRLLIGGGGSFPTPLTWQIAGGATLEADLAAVYTTNAFTVSESGTPVAFGYRAANAAVYDALYVRDHAYTVWHRPTVVTAAQRQQFVAHCLTRLSTSPPNFVANKFLVDGTVNHTPGRGTLPIMDGIYFVILVLWADWRLTGDLSTFTTHRATIETCLETIPRSANGSVWSDPAAPSIDYAFADRTLKTGDCTYGTALMAWSYKMLADMDGENGSGPYSTARAEAEAGLATLRNVSGWYKGSSGNNAAKDDVWATALIVAEGLAPLADRQVSAQTIADAYLGGTISQNGLVRHLPIGQFWVDSDATQGTYQNGGYWATPVWDCVRAVDLVDPPLARTWAEEFIDEIAAEYAAEGTVGAVTAPYEWRNGVTLSTPKGYTASAALVHRFV
jgi:hypothetical protein